MTAPLKKIAYLAPRVPSRSETFVVDEMAAVRQQGVGIDVFSVHPAIPGECHPAEERITYLYAGSAGRAALRGFTDILRGSYSAKALSGLWQDLLSPDVCWREGAKLMVHFMVGATLARQLLERRCQHLHIHFAHVPTQIGMYASLISGVPFTFTAHANDIYQRGLLLPSKAIRSQKMLTISHFNLEHLADLGVPRDKLAVVRCGVSFPMATWAVVEPARRDRHDGFVVGSLGRLVDKKGFDLVIEAIHHLAMANTHLTLEIAGDGPLRDVLEQAVLRLGLESQVRFLGPLTHDQVATWMQNLDAFVLACRQDQNGDVDGIPVVLMEAISQATPVVTTRVTGIPELVVDCETGLLVEPEDVAGLSSAIRLLCADRAEASRLNSNAQRLVAEEFSQTINIARLLGHMTDIGAR